MKTISRISDLEACGIVWLTGEACGLSHRVLCDQDRAYLPEASIHPQYSPDVG